MSSLDAGGPEEMGHRRVSGLRSHRGKDGRLYWITDTHVGGRPPKGQRVYESWGAIAREIAERHHDELIDITWRRVRGFGPPENEPVGYTFEQAVERYLGALRAAGRDPKTVTNYELYLGWSARFFGAMRLSWIKLEDAEKMRARLRDGLGPNGQPLDRPLAFRTRKNIERIASQLFRFAMDTSRGWCERNPFDSLVTEKPPKGSRRSKALAFIRLHPREDSKLLDACEDDRQRCAVAIGLYLGVRAAPVAALRIEDVNLFSGTICVPSEFNKGHAQDVREDQWLPIPRHLTPYVRTQYQAAVALGSGWLFPTGQVRGRTARSGHVHRDKLRQMLLRATKIIGYTDGITFHVLRAICNNRLRAAGIKEALGVAASGARGILGHASEQAARPYIDANIDYMRPVIEAYDRWLDEMSGVTVADIRDKR